MIHRPVALGLTLCEQAIVEENSKNVTLVNCFTRLNVKQVPWVAQSFVAFAALIDGLGEMVLDLIVYRLDTFEAIYTESYRTHFLDRLQEVRFLFRVNQCSFPVPGRYQVTLVIDKEPVAQRLLQVNIKENLP